MIFLLVEEVTNFCQMDLVSEDVMLLDATYTLYVWIGEQSNKEEKRRAYDLAMEYLRTGSLHNTYIFIQVGK